MHIALLIAVIVASCAFAPAQAQEKALRYNQDVLTLEEGECPLGQAVYPFVGRYKKGDEPDQLVCWRVNGPYVDIVIPGKKGQAPRYVEIPKEKFSDIVGI